MKKVLSLFLALIFVVGICFSAPITITASAEENKVENESSNDFQFELNEDGKSLTVKYYRGSETTVVVPAEYNGMKITAIADSAFVYSTNIEELTISEGIVKVNGLSELPNLRKVNFPSTVTVISYGMFMNCPNLTEIVIPDTIKEIETFAFTECTNLEKVVIGSGVEKIGTGAFSNCPKLSQIEIKGTIKEIGQSAFSGTAFSFDENNWENDMLILNNCLIEIRNFSSDTFVVPEGVTAIAPRLFGKSLVDITLPESLLAIPNYAFIKCSFSNITIPSKVEYIGEYAFDDCKQLETITLNDGLKEIKSNAFSDCTALTQLIIPDSVEIIGEKIIADPSHDDWNDMGGEHEDETWEDESGMDAIWTSGIIYTGPVSDVRKSSIKKIYIGSGVKKVGKGLFSIYAEIIELSEDNKNIIISDDGVVYSGTTVIDCCSNASKTCTILDGTTEIAEKAFNGTSVEKVVIPASVEKIGIGAFAYCPSLETVEFQSNKLTRIEDGTFYGCESLKEAIIPNGITSIGLQAFGYCSNLEEVELPDSVVEIGGYEYPGSTDWSFAVFISCTNIKNVKIGAGANYIPGLIYNSIESLEISEKNPYYTYKNGIIYDNFDMTVEAVIWSAFDGSWYIPKNLTNMSDVLLHSIKEDSKENGKKITSFEIEEGNTAFSYENGVLYNKDKTKIIFCTDTFKTFTVPESVTEIGYKAFSYNELLEELIISNSVTKIEYSAIDNCPNLSKVTMSNNVEEYDAFGNCPKLTTIPIGKNTKSVAGFYNCEGLTVLDIPEGVTSISGFGNCENITQIIFPTTLKTIGYYSFCGLIGLTSLTIPGNVKEIDKYSFQCCENLESVVIEDGVEKLGESVFSDNKNLASIELGKTIIEINEGAFQNTKYVNENWAEDENFLYIDKYLFAIRNREEITGDFAFPEGTLGFVAVFNSTSITSLEIPDSVLGIPFAAFGYCSELTTVKIGKGVKKVGEAAFIGCDKIQTFDLGENTNIKLENGILSDSENIACFIDSLSDGKVTIPDGITAIPRSMFSRSNITEITIPNTVK
ncbi:MAG: leucine-rich repeat protein, partial [Clostridia bacterium]|nr:leucine-rich repeat protein [Clostridia bacterium]